MLNSTMRHQHNSITQRFLPDICSHYSVKTLKVSAKQFDNEVRSLVHLTQGSPGDTGTVKLFATVISRHNSDYNRETYLLELERC